MELGKGSLRIVYARVVSLHETLVSSGERIWWRSSCVQRSGGNQAWGRVNMCLLVHVTKYVFERCLLKLKSVQVYAISDCFQDLFALLYEIRFAIICVINYLMSRFAM